METYKKRNNLIYSPDRELLRLATAGSVDDGKSTLIGRLFFDCQAIYEDQFLGIKKNSDKKGLKEVDLSLLTDGLSAEREQGITIDVAYQYFNTEKRRIIIADVPGHEQYTKNMITGASEADVVLILVDAGRGMTTQSKRHLFLSSFLNVSHIIVAINKMDSVGYEQEQFEKIKNDFLYYAAKLNITDLKFIPVSALKGDMVVERGGNMPWYEGDTLLYYLENIAFHRENLIDFRLPIQTIVRAGKNFRGYAGKIEGGALKTGDEIMVLPSKNVSKIKSILIGEKKVAYAFSPQSVMVSLSNEIDVSRGDFIIKKNNQPEISDGIEAMICNVGHELLRAGKNYYIKILNQTARVKIDQIYYRLNIDSLHHEKSSELAINEIGRVFLRSGSQLIYDVFLKNKNTGSFILIDEVSKNTIAAGVVLDKGKQRDGVIKKKNGILKTGLVLWFTGLSGSGKSTIADQLFSRLMKMGIDCEKLDGDTMRKNLCSDLGFSSADRNRNIERASYLAGLLSRHSIVVLASFISPYRKARKMARKNVKNFVEIFVDAPLEVCEKRDTKGLYKKARIGQLAFFTGIGDKYEIPKKPDIHLQTDKISVDESVGKILTYLEEKKYLSF